MNKTPFEIVESQMDLIYNSTKKALKKSKPPVQFEKNCPQCDNFGKVYQDDGRLMFHCYSCGYVSPWTKVAGELREKDHDCHASPEDGCDCQEYSPEYPLGGMIEPYDIEREKELTN